MMFFQGDERSLIFKISGYDFVKFLLSSQQIEMTAFGDSPFILGSFGFMS
jgi:hypothetical protein